VHAVNGRPQVRDIRSYLLGVGWTQHEETWRGASIWSNADGREVLVPANDELADTELRIMEILAVLTEVEERPASEIVTDIETPLVDIQSYQIPVQEGFFSLPAGLHTLQGARTLITVAARTVIHGPLPVNAHGTPAPVTELLRRIELGYGNPGAGAFSVRIPLTTPNGTTVSGTPGEATDGPPLGRQVGYQLRASIIAARTAAIQSDPAAFDDAVSAGVSADLCKALAELTGTRHHHAFEISFRWGRGITADVPADAVRFPAEVAPAVAAGAERLRRLEAAARPTASAAARVHSATAMVTGRVASLHGPARDGGWLVRVRGDLIVSGVMEGVRTVRVLLDDAAAYDRAIEAHRSGEAVRARGALSWSPNGKPIELHVDDGAFGP
jgi:hypothetical protein